MGFQKSYVIFRVGHGKCLRPITRWVGGVKKGQKHAYIIIEWSLRKYNIDTNTWGTLTTKFDTGSKLAVAYGNGIVKSTLVEHNGYIYRFGGIQGFSYHYRPCFYTIPYLSALDF